MAIKSIITDDFEHCYFCGRQKQHTHHIMNASNKKKSEKYGLMIPVCFMCHDKIHEKIKDKTLNMKFVKKLGQRKFEQIYSRELWMQEFEKNYLWEEEE